MRKSWGQLALEAAVVLCGLAAALWLCGCTSHFNVDLANGDMYGFKTWPWDSQMAEECADLKARAEYYGWGARTQYATNECHRIEVVMFDEGKSTAQTNVIKRARYWIWGERQ